jgi:hypothetical protein
MKRFTLHQVAANTDEVLAGFPMPPGSTLVNAWVKMDCSPIARVAVEAVVAYAVKGYVLPILDPEGAATWLTIWDNLVPKDELQADDALDLTSGAADTTPFTEFGVPNLNEIVSLEPFGMTEIFKRAEIVSKNTHPHHLHLDTTHFYWPGVSFSSHISRAVRSRGFSGVLFGFASPVMTSHSTQEAAIPTKEHWAMLMFLENTLENMLISLAGITEAGATIPYSSASTFLGTLLEPVVLEVTARAADFLAVSWDVNSSITVQVDMPGKPNMGNISGG